MDYSIREEGAGRSCDPAKGLSQSSRELIAYFLSYVCMHAAVSVSSNEEFTFSDQDKGSIGVSTGRYEPLVSSTNIVVKITYLMLIA